MCIRDRLEGAPSLILGKEITRLLTGSRISMLRRSVTFHKLLTTQRELSSNIIHHICAFSPKAGLDECFLRLGRVVYMISELEEGLN